MGSGGQKRAMHEIDETRAASKDDAFEKILERIISAGGEIISDETYEKFIDLGAREVEVGFEREIEFNLNKFDFKLIRSSETHRLQGVGKQKSVEKLDSPRIKISLKRKAETSQNWQIVDLDDMF